MFNVDRYLTRYCRYKVHKTQKKYLHKLLIIILGTNIIEETECRILTKIKKCFVYIFYRRKDNFNIRPLQRVYPIRTDANWTENLMNMCT